MATKRVRIPNPYGGPSIDLDEDLGPQAVYRGGAKTAASTPASTVGNMMPVMRGALPNLNHLSRGRAASKAFRIK